MRKRREYETRLVLREMPLAGRAALLWWLRGWRETPRRVFRVMDEVGRWTHV